MADWNRIQGHFQSNGGVPSFANAFGAAVANGDIIVAAVMMSTGFTLTSVTDNGSGGSNGYTIFNAHDDGSWYTASVRSNGFVTNAPTTLSYTFSGSPGTSWTMQDEFSPPTGAVALSADGGSSTVNSTGTSFTNFNTSLSDDLVYATAFSLGGIATHGAAFNAGTGDGTGFVSEWGVQPSAGTVAMNLATQTGNFYGPAFAINAGTGGGPAPVLVLMPSRLVKV